MRRAEPRGLVTGDPWDHFSRERAEPWGGIETLRGRIFFSGGNEQRDDLVTREVISATNGPSRGAV